MAIAVVLATVGFGGRRAVWESRRTWGEEDEVRNSVESRSVVINHGIPTGTIHRMKTAAAEFFKLPAQEKKKYPYDPNVLEGYGTPYPLSENESVDWSSALFLRLSPIQQRKLELWPTTPPELKDTVEAYSAEVAKVNKKLLGCLSLIMGMERNALFELHEEMSMLLRVTYYPTCCMPDQVLGLGPHSDASSITLLAQDDDVTGLQVLHDGGWVPVKPIPNALVVNIGDVMEIWSNGRYKSIDHRVVTTVEKARTSYASFVAPHKDVVMEPLEQMLDAQHRHGMYHKVKYENYLKYVLHRKLEGKAHMAKYTI
ncbi:hypothetical protein RJ640_014394 [Escallonia rubra]|uniref:Fe2OG dioxygenase domain-containing protein n=1 Tax=Escallonia rubra TaxID=112253 RepID=A0AA88QXX6_9ASTE|nr:hypothetical protein RJ640_014394 [Escallonia rubra]